MNKKTPKKLTDEQKERLRLEQEARQMALPGTTQDKGPPPNWWRLYGE